MTRSGFSSLLLTMLLLGWISSTASATWAAEKRIALVIGIGTYQNAPRLANPVNDARAIGDSLRRLNFDVQELYDPDYRQLSRGIREFGVHAQDADAAVVYYAGHGVQIDRMNYLLPADAKLERERDLLYEAFPLENVLGEVAQASRVGIVLLDSCRNNPFVARVSRSLTIAGRAIVASPGLARVDNVPRNTMVVMAAKADQIAEDGDAHSPFAAALLAHLQIPGLELSLFFRSVRDTVLKATNNRQEPYVFSSLGAEPFYFFPRPPSRPPELQPIAALEVADNAGPTLLGIPRPSDPDQDPITVRFTGLPRSGEIRVQGQPVASNDAFSVEKFMTATYKPDGKALGSVGTVDILVENGHGGSVAGKLPIKVISSHHPPVVASNQKIHIRKEALGITVPSSPDGDPLTVTITGVPRGTVFNDNAPIRVGEQLRPQDLPNLSFVPEPGFSGVAGSLRYLVDNGHGDTAEGKVDLEVTNAGEAARPQDERVAATPPRQPPVEEKPAAPPAASEQVAAASLPPIVPPAAAPTETRVIPRLAVQPIVQKPFSGGALDDRTFQDCPNCPRMTHVPAGSFTMGLGARDPEAAPAHRVTLHAFAIGQFPVTVAEWKACQADGGCNFLPRMQVADDRTPIYNISWDDTEQYIAWLSRITGKKYRLPSEAEWEYAARADTTTRYWWGEAVGISLANCTECGGVQNPHGPLPVDALKPNPFGLYDMLGGVAQWTADCWFSNYNGAPSDGTARDAKTCMRRVLRGGSFRSGRDDITVTARGNYDAPVRYLVNGFRVARDLN